MKDKKLKKSKMIGPIRVTPELYRETVKAAKSLNKTTTDYIRESIADRNLDNLEKAWL